MPNSLDKVFKDESIQHKLKEWLPYFFQMAELECSRAGKIGMEVGSVREKIIIAFLIYQFGAKNVNTNIPITEPEIDFKFFELPVSVKSMTGKYLSSLKLIWTVDPSQALKFSKHYKPSCDILLAHVNWNENSSGALYHFPLTTQVEVFKNLGRDSYITLPKQGTNPRGVEMSKEATRELAKAKGTQKLDIKWEKKWIPFDPHRRWIELWKKYAGNT